jgi:hypothetical protein
MEYKNMFSRLKIPAFYSLVALAIFVPLFGRGFILTLDMVFTPHIRMPASVSSSYVLRALLHVLNFVLPGDVVEKLLLFVIFVLAGVGMHKLVDSVGYSVKGTNATKGLRGTRFPSLAAPVFSGIFYMVNPLTYDRLMAGQHNVLFGYALLPWFARALLNFISKPDWRKTVELSAWAIAISIVSIHTIGFIAMLTFFALCITIWRRRFDLESLKVYVKFSVWCLIFFLIASSYWLVPLLLGHGNTAAAISGFGAPDRAAFATLGGNWIGRFGNVLLLQGFWAENTDMFNLPQDQVPIWFILAAGIWFLVLIGAIRLWRTRRRTELFIFGSAGLSAGILAAGTFNNWLAGNIPFFVGYREPQKFVALAVLAFALFAGQGAAAIIEITANKFQPTSRKSHSTFYILLPTFLLLSIPFLYTPTILWGANNQLAPAHYPPEWFAINKKLDLDKSNFKVLFLPWHEYMMFDFEGRIIASPAPQFFDKPVIISNDPEFGNIEQSKNSLASGIGKILSAADHRDDLAIRLSDFNVKYIILDNDDDYTNYNYLQHQPGLQLISKSGTLELYRNNLAGE